MDHHQKYTELFVDRLEQIFDIIKANLKDGTAKTKLIESSEKAKEFYSSNMFLPITVIGPLLYKSRKKIHKNKLSYINDMDKYVKNMLDTADFERYGWMINYIKNTFDKSTKEVQLQLHKGIKYLLSYYIQYKSPVELIT